MKKKFSKGDLKRIIKEELVAILMSDSDIDPPDSTDAWHPRDVVPLEDAWSGGDNIDSPVDHAYVETGESNAGPHSVMGFSGTPEPLGDDYLEFSPDGELLSLLALLMEEEAPGEEIADFSPGPDGLFDPQTDEMESPAKDQEIEREDIVVRILGDMEEAGITGDLGLFRHVDNVDEFEDLIRFIFQDVELDNRQLAGVALRISQDFLENPEDAASLSNFNL